jgi:hypothetical protein
MARLPAPPIAADVRAVGVKFFPWGRYWVDPEAGVIDTLVGSSLEYAPYVCNAATRH